MSALLQLGLVYLDCIDANIDTLCQNIYHKITSVAEHLVETGENIEKNMGFLLLIKEFL